MQPYLFPYIGYFQLIAVCDVFVIYDDVQYRKGGWVNRNRILVDGVPKYLTLPLKSASTYLPINKREFADTFETDKAKVRRQVQAAYHGAPHFEEAFALVQQCLNYGTRNLSAFLASTLDLCCQALGIRTELRISSKIDKTPNFRGRERVIDIVERLGANHYINAIGGRELYDPSDFAARGIKLSFLQPQAVEYPQSDAPFVPWLSIIDVMMFNSKEETAKFLSGFDLI